MHALSNNLYVAIYVKEHYISLSLTLNTLLNSSTSCQLLVLFTRLQYSLVIYKCIYIPKLMMNELKKQPYKLKFILKAVAHGSL